MVQNAPFATKSFRDSDLKAFAAISGDRNPLHMDALAARRTPEGRRVVHGALLLLYGLDQWVQMKKKRPFERIRCTVKKPVLMDERVDYVFGGEKDGQVKILALVEGLPCVEIVLSAAEPASSHEPGPTPKEADEKLSRLTAPKEWERDDFLGFSATIRNPSGARFRQAFPRLSKTLGTPAVSALARLSYIVGMVCPGLYSLFSTLDVTVGRPNAVPGLMTFEVTSFDERFRLLEMRFDGDLRGSLKAFRRPKPFLQPAMESVRGSVAPGEFAACKALVIGGSRGLGELTAKLLCAGGGEVWLGYHRGKGEVARIADEIKSSGLGVCHPAPVDILARDPAPLRRLLSLANCVYYYPTPPIFKKQPKVFFKRHFEEFTDFYVERFYGLCEFIEQSSAGKVQVYYPSSTALDQRPNGMTAYAMAKAAAEVLIQDMNRAFKRVEVLCTRLPRLGSDQTNSVMDVRREDNLAVLLPIVREIRNRLKAGQ